MIAIADITNAADNLVNLQGKGKFSAGVVLRQLVDQFIHERGGGRRYKTPNLFTKEEIAAMKRGHKLEAVKLYKTRTGASLFESKNFVEKQGAKYLMQSGRYGDDGMIIPGVP